LVTELGCLTEELASAVLEVVRSRSGSSRACFLPDPKHEVGGAGRCPGATSGGHCWIISEPEKKTQNVLFCLSETLTGLINNRNFKSYNLSSYSLNTEITDLECVLNFRHKNVFQWKNQSNYFN
jgi:hypothetical protein